MYQRPYYDSSLRNSLLHSMEDIKDLLNKMTILSRPKNWESSTPFLNSPSTRMGGYSSSDSFKHIGSASPLNYQTRYNTDILNDSKSSFGNGYSDKYHTDNSPQLSSPLYTPTTKNGNNRRSESHSGARTRPSDNNGNVKKFYNPFVHEEDEVKINSPIYHRHNPLDENTVVSNVNRVNRPVNPKRNDLGLKSNNQTFEPESKNFFGFSAIISKGRIGSVTPQNFGSRITKEFMGEFPSPKRNANKSKAVTLIGHNEVMHEIQAPKLTRSVTSKPRKRIFDV